MSQLCFVSISNYDLHRQVLWGLAFILYGVEIAGFSLKWQYILPWNDSMTNCICKCKPVYWINTYYSRLAHFLTIPCSNYRSYEAFSNIPGKCQIPMLNSNGLHFSSARCCYKHRSQGKGSKKKICVALWGIKWTW